MAQHYSTGKKKKKEDGGGIVGAIVTIVFLIILAAGVYYLVNLFKGEEITPATIAGEWKIAGNPSLIFNISADGTAHSYEQFTVGNTRNEADYTYTLEPNDNGVMVLKLTNVKDGSVQEIKITKVSRAQISIIRNGSSFESMTTTHLF